MKKFFSVVLAALLLVGCIAVFTSCGNDTIIVSTNAFFAPFEYSDGDKIVGVEVEIMELVGKKMDKKVKFENGEFSAIIDNVAAGKVADCGAAGITITDERKEKVDFSIPYYTSVQYVIFSANDASIKTKTVDGKEYIVWEALAGKKIGTQTDTTGWIYTDSEVGKTDDYTGILYDTGAELKNFDSAQLAADGVGNLVDVVIIDQLPAEYIVSKQSSLKCLPLYYAGDTDAEDAPVEEQYAIAVTKGNTKLLDAINEVLKELLVKDSDGKTEIEKMVMKHMVG